jgi:hypothetical protein
MEVPCRAFLDPEEEEEGEGRGDGFTGALLGKSYKSYEVAVPQCVVIQSSISLTSPILLYTLIHHSILSESFTMTKLDPVEKFSLAIRKNSE